MSKTDASIFTEKGAVAHHELLAVPETITEGDEDESGNVGLAAYEKSKHMEELVSCPILLPFAAHPNNSCRPTADSCSSKGCPAEDRLVHSADVSGHSNHSIP